MTRPLINNEILKATPKEKDFTLHDYGGLFLLVRTSGKKLWHFRYQRPNSAAAQISALALTLP